MVDIVKAESVCRHAQRAVDERDAGVIVRLGTQREALGDIDLITEAGVLVDLEIRCVTCGTIASSIGSRQIRRFSLGHLAQFRSIIRLEDGFRSRRGKRELEPSRGNGVRRDTRGSEHEDDADDDGDGLALTPGLLDAVCAFHDPPPVFLAWLPYR